jgi:hypothetical protein
MGFPNQGVGLPGKPLNATLTNRGTLPLGILKIATVGNYSQTNNCGAGLAAGASCTIAVKFVPVDSTMQFGNLAVVIKNQSVPLTTRLRGYGQVGHLSATKLTFASQPVGTTSPPKSVTLTNLGSTALTIAGIVAGGDFAQTNDCPSALAVQATCTIQVTFTPTQPGTRTGAVQITDSDFNSPQLIKLAGTGQ